MGRTEPGGKWLDYFQDARTAAGYVERGWQSRLARDIDVSDSQVTKWIQKHSKPSMETAKRLAEAWGLPLLQVWVGMEYVDGAAVGLADSPPPPPKPRLSPELQRLAKLLDGDAPEDTKARIRAMITAAADLGELSSSTERPTGRSA